MPKVKYMLSTTPFGTKIQIPSEREINYDLPMSREPHDKRGIQKPRELISCKNSILPMYQ